MDDASGHVMQDYKAPRVSQRRSFLRGRFLWLKRRKRPELPQGFRPLKSLSSAKTQDSRVHLRGLPGSVLAWAKQRPLVRWAYALVAVWVIAGAGIRGWETWRAPLERVRVSGLVALSSAQVVQMSGLMAGMRLSELDPYLVSLRLRQDSRVEAADTRRVYPNTVWIDVRERIPDARVVLGDGQAALVDRYNVVIRVEPARGGDLPLIRGIGASAQLGAAIAAPGLTRARIFLTQAKEARIAGFERSILDVGDPESITVTGARPPRLVFPSPPAGPALLVYSRLTGMDRAAPVVQALSSAGSADFRFVEGPDVGRLYLRP